ncbi:iron-siderophore ABC transporter substrate-binding protein [Yinghuangia soli]|uniref:Iron-siderophore ABC transporter substrate-binding protein n=1 Tax=Yinghuangia soli TaxID=2908204 RepID=A0AA41QA41_9ACTN|nr:iron-siderophore ABC transporter substrate-binding protein [Yinghuangia soli]MCF2533541.1 iron-siderophore ABC transporter substrate-binding protein [Yinghuangia soli]
MPMSSLPSDRNAAPAPRFGRHRRRPLVVVAVAAALLAAGCSEADDPKTAVPAAGSPSSGAPGTETAAAFPRTVKTALGDVVIPRRPERIVTVGFPTGTADAAIASGVVPVGMPKAVGAPDGIDPWIVPKLNGKKPTLIEANKVDIEQIAALKPDLILAGQHRAAADDYAKLSKIAPVITYEGAAAFQDTWQQQTQLIGKALGTEKEAAAAIARVEAKFAEIRAKHPSWNGKTFTFTQGGSLAQIPTVTDPNEASARMFAAFGLQLDPKVTALGAKREVSAERLDTIDAGLVVMFFPSADAQKTFEANAVFSNIPAVKEGRYITVDSAQAFALISPGVLNVEWAIDQILPKLEMALGAS